MGRWLRVLATHTADEDCDTDDSTAADGGDADGGCYGDDDSDGMMMEATVTMWRCCLWT